MKKTIKIVAILLMAILVIATLTQGVSAVSPTAISAKDNSSTATKFSGIMGMVLGIVRVIGTGIAVIMLIVLAIKYISAAPGDKAEIKKHAVVYIVGAVVLFGASQLLGLVQTFTSETLS